MKTSEIRNTWIKYFESKNHHLVEDKTLIPINDDSLLFINSGIATLKSYFDGTEKPVSNRLVNAQRSLRTNDIENVGVTSRHHTIFEMLGNFSIGDYFKDEAIEMGLELLISPDYFNIPIEKLYITIHPNDEVSLNKWIELGISEDKIIKLEENFWEIGRGPGGPNTEIFYDRGESYDSRNPVNLLKDDLENDRVIEIWNIVFSEFNCMPDTLPREEYPELPNKNIDTGMGLERMACILQDVETNFDTDGFLPIIKEIEKLTNIKYQDSKKPFRVITDHIRALVFAISDGIYPSNEGRGYVIRRLLRRSVKFGYLNLEIKKPFLEDLVDTVIDINSDYYTFLKDKQVKIKEIINQEEVQFLKTIDEGIKLTNSLIKSNDKISGKDAFKLYDTYGFPIEITQEIAHDHNLEINLEEFEAEMLLQKQRAKEHQKQSVAINIQSETLTNLKVESKFVGYTESSIKAKIIALIQDDKLVNSVQSGVATVVLDETPFYATGGGQIHDIGHIDSNVVIDVVKNLHKQNLHIIEVNSKIEVDQEVMASIDLDYRKDVQKNHSVTHILHNILREVFGTDTQQRGSYQDNTKTRFDFVRNDKIDFETIALIQDKVNEFINKNIDVSYEIKSYDEAIDDGAVGLFGEKYDEDVRVLTIDKSVELCGGTHVNNTKEINKFYIVSESSIGSGIRRIEAVVDKYVDIEEDKLLKDLNDNLLKLKERKESGSKVKLSSIQHLLDRLKLLKRVTLKQYQDIYNAIDYLQEEVTIEKVDTDSFKQKILDNIKTKDDHKYVEIQFSDLEIKDARIISDQVINEVKDIVLVLKLKQGNSINIIVKVSKEISNTYSANEILQQALKPYDGKGGGSNTMAQGGGYCE